MAKKPVVFEDRKFNSKVEYTRYIRNYLNPLGVIEIPNIKEEDILEQITFDIASLNKSDAFR